MTDGALAIIIKELLKRQAEHNDSALNRAEGDSFQYGKACGIHQTFTETIQIVQRVLDDAEPSQLKGMKVMLDE